MNIELAKPNFGALELSYLDDALSERGGPYHFVERFEADFAAWVGRHYALMTPNCTSALHLTLKSLGIGPGDEVIVPDLTWIASAAPIVYVGATPLFADIDESSWCLLVRSVERLVTPKTKAIIAVDLYGNTIGEHQGTALYTIGQRHGLTVHRQEPHYVVAIEPKTNTLTVSSSKDDAARETAMLTDVHWIHGAPSFPHTVQAQARYRERSVAAHVVSNTKVTFLKPHIAAPGQSLVVYEGEQCLGGGIIAN